MPQSALHACSFRVEERASSLGLDDMDGSPFRLFALRLMGRRTDLPG